MDTKRDHEYLENLEAKKRGVFYKMINDVEIIQLNRICDERGRIMHMLKSTDVNFEKFGEIYFSTAYQVL